MADHSAVNQSRFPGIRWQFPGAPLIAEIEPSPAFPANDELLGQRLARIRKERGFTQSALAERTGLTQVLVSDYERSRIRLSAEMAVRLAEALGISTDELLRTRKQGASAPAQQPRLKLIRRMEQIEGLPLYQQRALLTTIDNFIAAQGK